MRRLAVNPNRMQLFRLRKRLALAQRGHKLLKDKQEELTRQFLITVREARSLRTEVEPMVDEIYRLFGGARASMSREEMTAALAFPRRTLAFDVRSENIMSVHIPVFEIIQSEAKQNYGLFSTSGNLDLAVKRLDSLFPRLVRLAQKEKAVMLLSADLEKTRQRVNALEYVLIPTIEETIKYISSRLAENERGAITRLMKVKDIIRKQR